jgi:hypothetical protein
MPNASYEIIFNLFSFVVFPSSVHPLKNVHIMIRHNIIALFAFILFPPLELPRSGSWVVTFVTSQQKLPTAEDE